MSVSLDPKWRYFLHLISETDEERRQLTRVVSRQVKKISDLNKILLTKTITSEIRNNVNFDLEKIEFFADPRTTERFTNMKTSRKFLKETAKNQRKAFESKLHSREINEDGNIYLEDSILGNFFDDLNAGDLVLKFENKEREINEKLEPEFEDLGEFYRKFIDSINVPTNVKELHIDYLSDERVAFFNALLFFSTGFYAWSGEKAETADQSINRTSLMDEEDINELRDFLKQLKNWSSELDSDYLMLEKQKSQFKQRALIAFLQALLAKNKEFEAFECEGEGLLSEKNIEYEVMMASFKFASEKVWSMGEEKVRQLSSAIFEGLKRARTIERAKGEMMSLKLADPSPGNLEVIKKKDFKVLGNNFFGVVRRILRVKMSQMGLFSRAFHSSSFKEIFVVIKAQPGTILSRAEVKQLPKAYELGVADLLSFEPLDTVNRPFRLKKFPTFSEFEERKNKVSNAEYEMFMGNGRENFDLRISGGDPRTLAKLLQDLEDLTDFDVYKLLSIRLVEFKNNTSKFFQRSANNFIDTHIIKDKVEDRDDWHAFIIFSVLLEYHFKSVNRFSNQKFFDEFRGITYRLLFIKSLEATNDCMRRRFPFKFWRRNYVESFWQKVSADRLYFPHSTFEVSRDQTRWRTYEINELGERNIFTQMERIKLMAGFLADGFKLDELVNDGFIAEYFPIHDQYHLFGKSKLQQLISVLDIARLLKERGTKFNREISKFFAIVKDSSDSSDFIGSSLRHHLRLRWYYPIYIEISPIRDYFGEKIALYFSFVRYYAHWKVVMGFIGLVFAILCFSFLNSDRNQAYRITTLVFMCFVITWAVIFKEIWKRRMNCFALEYGQHLFEDDSEANIRPGFKGDYIRDVHSNRMNKLYYSPFKRFLRMVMTYSVSFLIICLAIGVSLLMTVWQNSANDGSFSGKYGPAIVNSIQIFIFNEVYQNLAFKFNDYENHENLQSYEDSLILKLFCFNFANTFNSMFIVAFVQPYTDIFGGCSGTSELADSNSNCFNDLSYQVAIVFITQFILTIAMLFLDPLKGYIIGKINEFFKNDPPMKQYIWQPVDKQIEEESTRDSYQTVLQVDGTLSAFNNQFNEFTFLALFGISFPLIFFIGMIQAIVDIHNETFRLMFWNKRPMPTSAKNIGLWMGILEFTIYLCILTNAAIFSFTLNGFLDYSETDRFRMFMIIVIVFLFVKYTIEFFVSRFTRNFDVIKARNTRVAGMIKNTKIAASGLTARAGVFLNIPPGVFEEFFRDLTYVKDKLK